jgi:hypothetical protein
LAKGAAAGYQGFGTVYGVLESGGNILSGKGTGWDALNLLPLGGVFKGGRAASRVAPSPSSISNQLDNLAADSRILGNVIESSQARSGSGFAAFSRRADDVSDATGRFDPIPDPWLDTPNLSSVWEGTNSRINKTRNTDLNYAWRSENLSDNSFVMYSASTLGDPILANKFSSIASERINRSQFTTILDYTDDVAHGLAGETNRNARTVRIYYANNMSPKEAISTLVHESVHVERRTKGIIRNSLYEEYLAFVREEIYKNNGRRPSFEKRIEIWDKIKDYYGDLDELKDPTRNIRKK